MIKKHKIFLIICFISFLIIIVYNSQFKLNLLSYYLNINNNNLDKWIVVTSINDKLEKKLKNEKEFQLLVVTNKAFWSHKNNETIYLNKNNLDYSILKTISFNNSNAQCKNIAYLYAIQNGAKFIYDTDDTSEPIDNLIDYFDFNNEFKTELEYDLINSPLILNPYAHFGQPTIWPRGFPLNEAINKKLYNDYILVTKSTSIIQQSLVNADPHVDSSSNKELIKFDTSSPSVRIPLFKLTPFNSKNTLFHYEAFWALYLPHTVASSQTDIWRSYWAQRLMWLLNSTVSIVGPNTYNHHHHHHSSYLSDYKQEKTQDLIQLLYKWKCKFKSFYLCVIDLSEQMASNNFWDLKEIDSIKNWLNDLKLIDYKEPIITNNEYELADLTITQYLEIKKKSQVYDFRVRFTPRFKTFIDINNYYGKSEQKMKSLERQETFDYFKAYCINSNTSLNFRSEDQIEQKNLTLLITFNHDTILEHIIFLKQFHQSYFRNIVFCGYNILNKIRNDKLNFKQFDSFTFIDYDTKGGFLHYACMSKLIDLNLKTNGILLMSDDVLLKHWNLNSLNTNDYWYPEKPFCKYDLILKKDPPPWMTHTEYGEKCVAKVFDLIQNITNGLKESRDKEIIKKYVKIYTLNNLNVTINDEKNDIKLTKACKEPSDIFYLPKRLFKDFTVISKIFSKNKVFLEIALPTILTGLSEFNNETLNGFFNYWGQIELNKYYYQFKHYLHPVKLNSYNTQNARNLNCDFFISDKFNNF
jgi:hypothetical protein